MLVTKAIGDPLVLEFLGANASDKALIFYCSYALDALGFTLDVRYTDDAVGSRMILNHVCDITELGGRSELPPGASACFFEALRVRTGASVYVSRVKVRSRPCDRDDA